MLLTLSLSIVAVVIVVILADEPVIKPLAGHLHTLSAGRCGGRRTVHAQRSPVPGGLWRTDENEIGFEKGLKCVK